MTNDLTIEKIKNVLIFFQYESKLLVKTRKEDKGRYNVDLLIKNNKMAFQK